MTQRDRRRAAGALEWPNYRDGPKWKPSALTTGLRLAQFSSVIAGPLCICVFLYVYLYLPLFLFVSLSSSLSLSLSVSAFVSVSLLVSVSGCLSLSVYYLSTLLSFYSCVFLCLSMSLTSITRVATKIRSSVACNTPGSIRTSFIHKHRLIIMHTSIFFS